MARWPGTIVSALLEVEALRFGTRVGPSVADLAAERIRQVESIAIDAEVVRLAARVPPPVLRSLDAIHLATALRIRDDVGAFFTYDLRLAAAARAHGFDVRSPGAQGAGGRVRFPR